MRFCLIFRQLIDELMQRFACRHTVTSSPFHDNSGALRQTGDRQRISGKRRRKSESVPGLRDEAALLVLAFACLEDRRPEVGDLIQIIFESRIPIEGGGGVAARSLGESVGQHLALLLTMRQKV